jgi:pimeloyl-ACP methyl ester carboxylesterase
MGGMAITALAATVLAGGWLVEPSKPGDFYRIEVQEIAGSPGDILRVEALPAPVPDGAQAWRVLYVSTGLSGEPIAVSAVIAAPRGTAPAEGRPVVAWAHGTTGVTSRCAPSLRADFFDRPIANALGISEFMVLGFCIGGPFIWNLLRRAPDRIVAAVLAQPSGFRPEMPDLFYQNNIERWGPALCARRPDITMAMVDAFLNQMYRANADFVFTVTREFVRSCQTPILVLPDDVPAHPYAVAMESVRLAPKAEVSIYPWKDPKDLIPQAVQHVREFFRKHRPVTAAH